jgi:hypothetical protein
MGFPFFSHSNFLIFCCYINEKLLLLAISMSEDMLINADDDVEAETKGSSSSSSSSSKAGNPLMPWRDKTKGAELMLVMVRLMVALADGTEGNSLWLANGTKGVPAKWDAFSRVFHEQPEVHGYKLTSGAALRDQFNGRLESTKLSMSANRANKSDLAGDVDELTKTLRGFVTDIERQAETKLLLKEDSEADATLKDKTERDAFEATSRKALKNRSIVDSAKTNKKRKKHLQDGDDDDEDEQKKPVDIDAALLSFLTNPEGFMSPAAGSSSTSTSTSATSSLGGGGKKTKVTEDRLLARYGKATVVVFLEMCKIKDSDGAKAVLIEEISVEVLFSTYVHSHDVDSFKTSLKEYGISALDGHKIFVQFSSD